MGWESIKNSSSWIFSSIGLRKFISDGTTNKYFDNDCDTNTDVFTFKNAIYLRRKTHPKTYYLFLEIPDPPLTFLPDMYKEII